MITIIRKNEETNSLTIEIVDGKLGTISKVATIHPSNICAEHGDAQEIAEVIREAVSNYIRPNIFKSE